MTTRMGLDDFDVTMARLEATKNHDEDDFIPNDQAYDDIKNVLLEVRKLTPHNFPRGTIAIGEGGQVYVYWRNEDKSVQLSCAPYGPPSISYIYSRQGIGEGQILLFHDVEQLKERLEWLQA